MLPAAVAFLTIGSAGIIWSTAMEVKTREPKYAIAMKVFPWIFGVGSVLMAVVVA